MSGAVDQILVWLVIRLPQGLNRQFCFYRFHKIILIILPSVHLKRYSRGTAIILMKFSAAFFWHFSFSTPFGGWHPFSNLSSWKVKFLWLRSNLNVSVHLHSLMSWSDDFGATLILFYKQRFISNTKYEKTSWTVAYKTEWV